MKSDGKIIIQNFSNLVSAEKFLCQYTWRLFNKCNLILWNCVFIVSYYLVPILYRTFFFHKLICDFFFHLIILLFSISASITLLKLNKMFLVGYTIFISSALQAKKCSLLKSWLRTSRSMLSYTRLSEKWVNAIFCFNLLFTVSFSKVTSDNPAISHDPLRHL